MEQLHSNTIETSRKPGKHLTLDERGIIQALHQQGHSLRDIATIVGCAHTTIYNEIRRGTPKPKSNRGRKPHRKWNRKNKHMKGRSIDKRPDIVSAGTEIGHWEGSIQMMISLIWQILLISVHAVFWTIIVQQSFLKHSLMKSTLLIIFLD